MITAPRSSHTPVFCQHTTWNRRPDLDSIRTLRYECVQCGCRGRKAFGSSDATILADSLALEPETLDADDEVESMRRARERGVYVQRDNGMFHARREDDEAPEFATCWKDAA